MSNPLTQNAEAAIMRALSQFGSIGQAPQVQQTPQVQQPMQQQVQQLPNVFLPQVQQPQMSQGHPQGSQQMHNAGACGMRQRVNKPARQVGNRGPFISETKTYAITVEAAAGVLAQLINDGSLATETNREFLKRSGNLQSNIDGRYLYALGGYVNVSGAASLGDLDGDLGKAAADLIANNLWLVGYENGTQEGIFQREIPLQEILMNHHSGRQCAPLLLDTDQITRVEQDQWRIRLDYPGVGRLGSVTLRDVVMTAENSLAVNITIAGFFAETYSEAVDYSTRGRWDKARRCFVV